MAEIVSTSLSAGYGHIGGALEVLERLAQHHHLMIATSRCLQVKGDTIAWIDEHFPGIFASTAVYFSGIWDAWNQAATLPAGVVRCANWYEVEVAIERLASDEPA